MSLWHPLTCTRDAVDLAQHHLIDNTATPFRSDSAWATAREFVIPMRLRRPISRLRLQITWQGRLHYHTAIAKSTTFNGYFRFLVLQDDTIIYTRATVSKADSGASETVCKNYDTAVTTDTIDVDLGGAFDQFVLKVRFESYCDRPAYQETQFLAPQKILIGVVPLA